MRTVMLIPIGINVGLTTISIGLIQKIQDNNFHAKFFKPVFYSTHDHCCVDHTTSIVEKMSSVVCLKPIKINHIHHFLIKHKKQTIIENILLEMHSKVKCNDVLLLEGICLRSFTLLSNEINYEISRITNAEVIFVCTIRNNSIVEINNVMSVIKRNFMEKKYIHIKGIIINEFKMIQFDSSGNFMSYFNIFDLTLKRKRFNVLDKSILSKCCNIPILGCIPWNSKLIEPNLEEISFYLQAYVINKNKISSLYIKSVIVYKNSDVLKYNNQFLSHTILLLSSDHFYNLETICTIVNSNNLMFSILLTDSNEFYMRLVESCSFIKVTRIPILLVKTSMLKTILLLREFNCKVSIKNNNKFNIVKNHVSLHIDNNFIAYLSDKHDPQYPMCSSVFIYNLRKLAKKNKKRILLPEGSELRIIQAASICASKNIAQCVLLGNQDKIRNIAKLNNIRLESNIEILNPELIRNNYIERFIQLRKKYKITTTYAKKMLKDNSVLSTLILESSKVDGLVSGSVNTTTNTILPALQLIKTSKNCSLVSSVFFMLLQDRVLLYADCAINPNPNSNQLAEIAIQSANTAISFGIFPKIAMLSYSTGISSSGIKVDKVREATAIVRKKCPNLIIDGPIQYDAAVDSIISKLKCPNSAVDGDATVFIFPDLNSGNITYKAVQRSTNIISIGPILQGIEKPVNDLSRGASVQDIVYTIAITAVQSK
ncbi:MAG: phosphate acetyltransferase [Buchnera aphidicola (Kaburagia rhusicola rhusicola)]